MIRILQTLLAFSFALTTLAQPVKRHGDLHVDGVQLRDAKNRPLVLRGMSFGWHNFHPGYYNAGAVRTLARDWRCTVVRAAMGVEPKGAYLQDSAGSIAKVEAVVDAAIREGIYVIIDWHSHNIQLEEARRFFQRMATRYGHQPHIIYELFNEPDQESWAEVKRYAEDLIRSIRAIDPDNLILVGSPHWDQDVHLPAADPIRGQANIMYTLHYYAATHKADLRQRATAALKAGLPLFISESAGMEATGDGPLHHAEWQAWIDWSEANRVSWVTWSVSDKDETCSVLKKGAPFNGNWKEGDLKESGRLVRNYLRRLGR